MENKKLLINGVDALSLYHKDCLFNKECILAFVAVEQANGNQHIKTQCTKCGYQTGGAVSKKAIQASDKIKRFNKRLYSSVYKKKLEGLYAMSGEHSEINKRLQQMKKAVKQGKLQSPKKRSTRKPNDKPASD